MRNVNDVETVVQLINQNAIAKHHVQIEVDAEEYYKIKDTKTDSVKGTDDFGCIYAIYRGTK